MYKINKKERMNRPQSVATTVTTKEEIERLLFKHKMIKDTINMNIDNSNFENYWVT